MPLPNLKGAEEGLLYPGEDLNPGEKSPFFGVIENMARQYKALPEPPGAGPLEGLEARDPRVTLPEVNMMESLGMTGNFHKTQLRLDDVQKRTAEDEAVDSAPQVLDAVPWETQAKPAIAPKEEAPTIDFIPWEQTTDQQDVNRQFDATSGMPGAQEAPSKSMGPRSLSRIGAEQDIGPEGVGLATQINIGMALGHIDNPQQAADFVRKTIELDSGKRAQVAFEPESNQLIYRLEGGDGKWRWVAGSGISSLPNDVAQALPGTGQVAGEIVGGTAAGALGGAAGAVGGPAGAGAGTVVGGAAGAGAAAYGGTLARLFAARDRGTLDMTDEQIFGKAWDQMLWAMGGTVAVGTMLPVVKKIWQLTRGEPVELLRTFQDKELLASGKTMAERLQMDIGDVARGPGALAEFPVTAGQQSGIEHAIGGRTGAFAKLPRQADAALASEEKIVRELGPGSKVFDVYAKQAQMIDEVDFAVFAGKDKAASVAGAEVADAVTKSDAGRLVQQAAAGARGRVGEKLDERLGRAETDFRQNMEVLDRQAGALPEMRVNNARQIVEQARDNLFESFSGEYRRIELADRFKIVDLAPFRAVARNIEDRYGQSLVPSLSLKGNSKALQEAMEAGVEPGKIVNGVQTFNARPASLAEIERLRQDISRELRTAQNATVAGTEGAGARAKVLSELRDGIDDSLAQSLEPEALGHIQNLRSAYAAAEDKFNQGYIGRLLERDNFGGYSMSGQKVVDDIVSDPAKALAFTDALRTEQRFVGGRIQTVVNKDMVGAVRAMQDGILSRAARLFKDADTGAWNVKGLTGWLHTNKDSLSILFRYGPTQTGDYVIGGGGNRMLNLARSARTMAETVDGVAAANKRLGEMFEKRLGVYTHDPAVLVKKLIAEDRVEDLKLAANLVRSSGGKNPVLGMNANMAFRRGLGNAARDDMVDGEGRLVASKMDAFLNSERGNVLKQILGDNWSKDVKTLSDMIKVHELRSTSISPEDMARKIGVRVPTLMKLGRFLRVIFPPFSPSGRGLTASLGLMSEKSQKIMGDMLADPERLRKFLDYRGPVDPLSRAFNTQLIRVGMPHVLDFWSHAQKVYGLTYDMLEDPQTDPGAGNRPDSQGKKAATDPYGQQDGGKAGQEAYKRMGQTQPVPEAPIKFSGALPDVSPEEMRNLQRPQDFNKPTQRLPDPGMMKLGGPQTDEQLIQGSQQLRQQGQGMRQQLAQEMPVSEPELGRDTFSRQIEAPNIGRSQGVEVPPEAVPGERPNVQQAQTEGSKQLVTNIGNFATETGAHIRDTMETFLYSNDKEAKTRAGAELATLFTGGGLAVPRKGKGSLGAGGGNLREVKGGVSKIEESVDAISDQLSGALKNFDKGGKVDTKVVRGHIDELRQTVTALEKENASLLPPMSKMTKKDLDRMGMTMEQYKTQLIESINYEIDSGVRQTFKVITGGANKTGPVTPQRIVNWLEDAGVQGVNIKRAEGGTTYVTFPDPAMQSGVGKVRIPADKHKAREPSFNTLETGTEAPAKQTNANSLRKTEAASKNAEGESFSEWSALVDALKWRLSRSPDGQFLIAPGKQPAPRPRPLEAEKPATLSRDPDQLQFNLRKPKTRKFDPNET